MQLVQVELYAEYEPRRLWCRWSYARSRNWDGWQASWSTARRTGWKLQPNCASNWGLVQEQSGAQCRDGL